MLKQRIITAAILIPLVVWSIFSASIQGFTYGLAIVLLVATLEWNHFVNYTNKVNGWIFSAVTVGVYLSLEYIADIQLSQLVIALALIWWLISLPLLFTFPFKSPHLLLQKPAKVLVGFIMLLSTFIALNILRNSPEYGPDYVMYLLLVIWMADSGAYFAGRAWGKHKLIPNVSPGKSWEGVAGAFVATLIVSVVALNVLHISSAQSIAFILVTVITVAYSIVGDLSESMFKRMANMKDSGNMLPGHGGILDRIDSLTSALPVFIAALWLMEKVV